MAKMQEEPKEDAGAKPATKKRKGVQPDPELSTPRPRKLAFLEDEEISEGDEDVPTPTSSANQEDLSDGEDQDLFKDRFRTESTQPKMQKSKVAKSDDPLLETPPTKKPEISTPGSSGMRLAATSEKAQEILAGIDDGLVAALPQNLSRQGLLCSCAFSFAVSESPCTATVTTSATS